MQEGNQSESGHEAEGMGSKFSKDDVLRHYLLASDDMSEKKDLDSFGQCPIRLKKGGPLDL